MCHPQGGLRETSLQSKLKDDVHVETLQHVRYEIEIKSADLYEAFQKTLVDIC